MVGVEYGERLMRALIYAGRRQLEWREAPDPRVTDGRHALLRPVAATTCDLDRFIIGGKTPFEPPFAIGHEAVAEVVDIEQLGSDREAAVVALALVRVDVDLHGHPPARATDDERRPDHTVDVPTESPARPSTARSDRARAC